jgi:hypothetical protein
MCGIFGFVISPCASVDRQGLAGSVRQLYGLAESRGKEAAGLSIVLPDRIEVLKRPLRGRRLLRDPVFGQMLGTAIDGWRFEAPHPIVLFGHTRMVTNGSATDHGNNQPVIKDGLVGIHNGIIVNDADLWRNHPRLIRNAEVDTEALLAVIAERRFGNCSLSESVSMVFGEARGANSIALASADDDALVLATTNGSLFYSVSRDARMLVFASERYILERIMTEDGLRDAMTGCEAVQIRPGEGFLVPFADPRPLAFSLERDRHHQALASSLVVPPPDQPSATRRRIVDHPAGAAGPASPHVSSRSLRELEALMQIDFDRIGALLRCSRCLLPETFPFIEFDAAGVCQHCRNHQPLRQMSEKELGTHCDSVRRADGRPDCLVPVSGGRDSSYGLHYIKKVLGLNPVAYTYDWGMVTDLARRNISRMCEALEVEHVLVAADIAQKREFVRLNVSAWLRRPHLGTVPLFMAGDKQFFYYAEMLKRQMDLRTVIFSMNRFERTDFKVGFCGINDTLRRKKLHGISAMSKGRLALFYAKEFVLNPAYLNRSLIDTLSAYLSFYVIPFNYLQLYDYLRWDEPSIEHTLINGYGWEVSSDSSTTWRIGDGTAPFYNYIYLRIAGFTENDTFRSNQIREGLLSRDQALDRVMTDNRPRAEGFKWYCDSIGIDPIDTLRNVNQVTTRYN